MNNPYSAYIESNVLSASPLELVRMLYQAALGSVRDARRYLVEGKIKERSGAITRALEVLAELNGSLDPSAGELAERLALLYDYLQRRLIDGNVQQTDAPLAEALSLLETLAEAWNGASADSSSDAQAPETNSFSAAAISSPWNPGLAQEPRAYARESWSF